MDTLTEMRTDRGPDDVLPRGAVVVTLDGKEYEAAGASYRQHGVRVFVPVGQKEPIPLWRVSRRIR